MQFVKEGLRGRALALAAAIALVCALAPAAFAATTTEYAASFVQSDGETASMMAAYIADSSVTAGEDATYTISFSFTETGQSYITDVMYADESIEAVEGVYSITVDSIDELIPVSMYVTMMGSYATAYVSVTATEVEVEEEEEETHTHTYEATETVEATCAEDGYIVYTCTEGDDSYTETLSATGEHSWDAGVVTTEATELVDGVLTYTCTVCGATYEEAIPATGLATNEDGLVIGAVYAMDVTYTGTGDFASLQSTLDSMVGQYFGYSVYVTPLEDGTYDLQIYFIEYNESLGAITYDGVEYEAVDAVYAINVPSISEAIDLSLYVGGTMDMTVTFALEADIDSAVVVASVVNTEPLAEAIDEANAIEQGSKTDDAWAVLAAAIAAAQAVLDDAEATQAEVSQALAALNSAVDAFNNSDDAVDETEEESSGWQVGHTYQVSIKFLKDGSSETSMADQYFGDTALVYVNADGTLTITFAATDDGLEQVTAIAYNGSTISQSGNQFSFTISPTYSNTSVELEMTIKAMTLLGVGSQTTDLYLYLASATDLGTGLEGMEASSSSSLAETGDATGGLVAGVGAAALLAGCTLALAAARRRRAA